MSSEYRREWLEYKGRDSGMIEEMVGKFIENAPSIFTLGTDLLGAFIDCQKRPLTSPCLSVYPSFHMEQLVSHLTDFIKFDI